MLNGKHLAVLNKHRWFQGAGSSKPVAGETARHRRACPVRASDGSQPAPVRHIDLSWLNALSCGGEIDRRAEVARPEPGRRFRAAAFVLFIMLAFAFFRSQFQYRAPHVLYRAGGLLVALAGPPGCGALNKERGVLRTGGARNNNSRCPQVSRFRPGASSSSSSEGRPASQESL